MPNKHPTKRTKRASLAKGRCARPGKVTYKKRKRLPNWAFALASKRKYILYTEGPDGKLAPSRTHAINAKSRARTQFDRGTLSEAEFEEIIREADAVLRKCK